MRSVYHEISHEDIPSAILLGDSGRLSVDATRFSYKTSNEMPLIELDGFWGDFTLLTGLLLPVNSTHTAQINIKGDGSKSSVLCMANLFWVNESTEITTDKIFHNRATPPAQAGIAFCNMNFNVPEAPQKSFGVLENQGTLDEDFIRKMLKPLRSGRIWLPGDTKPGITNLQMHRILCRSGKATVGVELRAGETGELQR